MVMANSGVGRNDAAIRTAQVIFEAIRNEQACGAQVEVEINVGRAVDALLMSAALLIDLDPNLKTPRDVRKAAEAAGDKLQKLLKSFHEAKGESGRIPMLEQLGQVRDPIFRDPDPFPSRN